MNSICHYCLYNIYLLLDLAKKNQTIIYIHYIFSPVVFQVYEYLITRSDLSSTCEITVGCHRIWTSKRLILLTAVYSDTRNTQTAISFYQRRETRVKYIKGTTSSEVDNKNKNHTFCIHRYVEIYNKQRQLVASSHCVPHCHFEISLSRLKRKHLQSETELKQCLCDSSANLYKVTACGFSEQTFPSWSEFLAHIPHEITLNFQLAPNSEWNLEKENVFYCFSMTNWF